MTDQEADELLTPEALAVLQTPLPDEPGSRGAEQTLDAALEAALEAAYQCALITSWVTPLAPPWISPRRRVIVVRRGAESEPLFSDLDAARWLADRVRERAPLIVERFGPLPESQTWRNWLTLLDRMADLAEHVAWRVA